MALKDHPLVVIGMQRSGTSSVAQALTHLGAFFGRGEDFLAADDNNATGYFELAEQVKLHKDIEFSFDRPWNSVKPFPDHWRELPQAKPAIEQLERLLAKHFNEKDRWGFKEPTTALLLPLYQDLLRSKGLTPVHVICVRNPIEVRDSINRHANSYLKEKLVSHRADPHVAGQSILSAPVGDTAIGLWILYTLGGLHQTIGQKRTLVLYDDFLRSPKAGLTEIVSQVDGWQPSTSEWDAALAGIRPDLRRFDAGDADLDACPPLVRKTFQLCRQIAKSPERFKSGSFDQEIEALWGEFQAMQRMFGEPAPPLGTVVATWRGREAVQALECAYEADEKWHKVMLQIDAPPSAELIGSFYHQPCVVWIRDFHWQADGNAIPAKLEPGPSCQLTRQGELQRLFANAEVFQFRTFTPSGPGPYSLEIEFFLETNARVVLEGISHLVNNLTALRDHAARLEQQVRGMGPRPGAPVFNPQSQRGFGGKR